MPPGEDGYSGSQTSVVGAQNDNLPWDPHLSGGLTGNRAGIDVSCMGHDRTNGLFRIVLTR